MPREQGTTSNAGETVCQNLQSLEDVTVDLGRVNVFIGANGSGKSNLLEALGILSAAADGRVDDQSLLARGGKRMTIRGSSDVGTGARAQSRKIPNGALLR